MFQSGVHALQKNNRKNIYIACQEMNFIWSDEEVRDFQKMWNEGKNIWDIADFFNRDPNEVAILIIDQRTKDRIEVRNGGIYGIGE